MKSANEIKVTYLETKCTFLFCCSVTKFFNLLNGLSAAVKF